MPVPSLTVDPSITKVSNAVHRDEMFERHNGYDDIDGSGVNIVVQDTGLDHTHPWVKDQTSETETIDFTGDGEVDLEGHGTMVTDLATRYATGASVEMHKVFPHEDDLGLQPQYDSFGKILNNPDDYDVLVMSWAVFGNANSRVDRLVNEIADKGIIPIAASGNSSGDAGSPATAEKSISIGALTEDGKSVTNFSSWDDDTEPQEGFEGIPEVSAIGKSIVGANADDGSLGTPINPKRTVASGTSFSCPFVANLVVDVVRRLDDPTVKEVLLDLQESATDIEKTSRDGLGRVNHEELLDVSTNGEYNKDDEDTSNDSVKWYLAWWQFIINLFKGKSTD